MNLTRSYAAKYWARAIAADVAVFGAFYLWRVEGVAGAGNVFLFAVWAYSIMSLLVGIVGDKATFENVPRPRGFATWHAMTEIALVVGMAWIGMVLLPALRIVSVMAAEGARNRSPKAKAE